MKKLLFLTMVLAGTFAMAQVTFNPGIRAGVNFARFTEGGSNGGWYYNDPYYNNTNEDADMSAKVDFYVGFQGNIRFAKMYALQPEINYSRQGTKVTYTNSTGNRQTDDITVSYIGFHLVNKFYMDKFNIHIGPTLEFQVEEKNFNSDSEADLGALLGVGYDITPNFGVEARIKKGFVPVAYSNDNHSNVTVQTGIYYTFPGK